MLIQPTFGNEVRKIKFELEDIVGDFNATFTIINEQIIVIDVIPDQTNAKLKFNIEGSLVDAVEIDGVNRTITFNPTGSGESEVEFTDEPFGIMKIFLPQNADTSFATFGRSLEGDFLNTLTTQEEEIFYNYLEFYEPSSTVLAELITDLKVDQQKAYEVIGKINKTGFYTTNANLEKGGGFYKDLYLSSTSITDFYNNLLQKVRDTASQVVVGDGD